jgi:mannose-6-phosphate isomerase-like protein (cupin superfamily)
MPFIDIASLEARELLPGWTARFFHSEHMTFAYADIAPGSRVHPHHHSNEEVWNVIEGDLEIVVGDTASVVRAGEAAVVPADVEHSAGAITRCRAIVVDYPVRERVAGVDTR